MHFMILTQLAIYTVSDGDFKIILVYEIGHDKNINGQAEYLF